LSRATVIHRCPRCRDAVYAKNAILAPSNTRSIGGTPVTVYYCKHCAKALNNRFP